MDCSLYSTGDNPFLFKEIRSLLYQVIYSGLSQIMLVRPFTKNHALIGMVLFLYALIS